MCPWTLGIPLIRWSFWPVPSMWGTVAWFAVLTTVQNRRDSLRLNTTPPISRNLLPRDSSGFRVALPGLCLSAFPPPAPLRSGVLRKAGQVVSRWLQISRGCRGTCLLTWQLGWLSYFRFCDSSNCDHSPKGKTGRDGPSGAIRCHRRRRGGWRGLCDRSAFVSDGLDDDRREKPLLRRLRDRRSAARPEILRRANPSAH